MEWGVKVFKSFIIIHLSLRIALLETALDTTLLVKGPSQCIVCVLLASQPHRMGGTAQRAAVLASRVKTNRARIRPGSETGRQA